jgi:hypothetical protein
MDTWDPVTLNWQNLTSVNFVGSGNAGGEGWNFYRVDNLTMASSAVPEPGSLFLLGTGLLGLGRAWRKRRQ